MTADVYLLCIQEITWLPIRISPISCWFESSQLCVHHVCILTLYIYLGFIIVTEYSFWYQQSKKGKTSSSWEKGSVHAYLSSGLKERVKNALSTIKFPRDKEKLQEQFLKVVLDNLLVSYTVCYTICYMHLTQYIIQPRPGLDWSNVIRPHITRTVSGYYRMVGRV